MGKDTTAPHLIESLRNVVCQTAVPDLLWSDGGPQFTSHKLTSFLDSWGISHAVSSPRYLQSNGKIEATVKSIKKLISGAWRGRSINWDRLSRSLLQYRNTPCRKDGLSPAQKLFGQPGQDHLPAHRRSFATEWQKPSEEVDRATDATQNATQKHYNQHAHSLGDLAVGSQVALQNPTSKLWDIYGTVTAIGSHRRYFVKTRSCRVFVRNRRFLWKLIPVSVGSPAEGQPETPPPPPHSGSSPTPCVRRQSTRARRPQRLIEEQTLTLSTSIPREE